MDKKNCIKDYDTFYRCGEYIFAGIFEKLGYLDKMTHDNNKAAVSQSGTKAVAPKQQKLAKHSAKVQVNSNTVVKVVSKKKRN